MKKLLIIPFLLLAFNTFAQTVPIIVLGQDGKLQSIDTSKGTLKLLGTFIKAKDSASIYLDTSRIITSVSKNATNDSFLYKNALGTVLFALKDSVGGGSSSTSWSLKGNVVTDSSFLGSTNNRGWWISNNTHRAVYFDSLGRVGFGVSNPQAMVEINGINQFSLNIGANVDYGGNGWTGFTLGETFGTSLVRKTGFVYRRTDYFGTGSGDIAVVSKRSGTGNVTYTDVHTNFATDGSVVINNGYNLTPLSILAPFDTSRGFLLPVQNTAAIKRSGGGAVTLSVLSGGSGYTGTSFSGAALTTGSGSGTGLQLSGTISGGAVTSATPFFTRVGLGYKVGDTVYANFQSGTGASFIITSTGAPGNTRFDTSSHQISVDNGNNIITGTVVSSSASTLSLQYGTDYIFTGTTSTWTLPAIVSNVKGRQNSIIIRNNGSGSITLNSDAGSTLIPKSSVTPASTITIISGASCELLPGGTYFNVLYNN